MRIDLGDLSFNTLVADGNGTHWIITHPDGLEGWDSPSLRQSFQDPAIKHGTVLTESLLGSRSLILRGIVKAPSEAAYWVAYNDLLGQVNNLITDIDLVVHEPTPKQMGVLRGGQPRVRPIGVGAFDFEVPLLARDPLKYSTTEQQVAVGASSTVTCTNAGNFTTGPRVTTTSSGTVVLQNNRTGQRITTESLPSGTVLDFAARTVYTGSTNRYTSLTPDSVWWELQPGANNIQNTGSASVSVVYRAAWL